MKSIMNFIKTSCAYAVLMLLLIYIFAAAMQFGEDGIVFAKFSLVILFAVVLAAAEYLFIIKSIKKIWATLLHYCILLFSFTVIFTWSGVLGTKSGNIFSSFFVFTFFYLLGLLCVVVKGYIVKKLSANQRAGVSEQKKSSYKPRYGDFKQ